MYIEPALRWCDGANISVVLRLIQLMLLFLLLKQSQRDIFHYSFTYFIVFLYR